MKTLLLSICLLFCNSALLAQPTNNNSELPDSEKKKFRKIIESINKQFSKEYLDGDSIALAAHYTKDGQLGGLKGDGILSYWGRSIRNSIKNNTRNIIFTTTALTGDSEFLVELGVYELKDDKNIMKEKGKYLVVWKQEAGAWKLYRDFGL